MYTDRWRMKKRSMFDILGIIKLTSKQVPLSLPERIFRNNPWNGNAEDFERYTVGSGSFRAIYLERVFGGNNYYVQNKKHFF